MKRSLFKKKSYQEIIAQKQAKQARVLSDIKKGVKVRSAGQIRGKKRSSRAKKQALKKLIIEQYGLPMLPCSRYGTGKAPTRTDILKGMLWHIFSLFIRLRDKDKPCIACGLIKENKQAGHFAPAGGNDLELCFSETNVNGECPECNADFNGGGWHLIQMRPNLIAKYGEETVLEIERLKGMKRSIKWEEFVYVEGIKHYYEEVQKLSTD